MIETRNLKKKYKAHEAVKGVSLGVPKGICLGLLGPNGAGKTTLVEMMENIIPPTSGEVLYKGEPIRKSFREEVGIQFQKTELLNFLTVAETLKTFAAFYKNPLSLEALSSLCMLDTIGRQYNNKISGGQRQRLLLGLALINNPELIFLDEPTTGLDPQARQHVWQIIQGIKDQGKTIILTTHYMEEAQILCDHLAIMDSGRIIVKGSPHELIKAYGGDADPSKRNLETVFLNLTGRRLRE
jgi:ABC-2 type transport system ATP-binding protein